jgi:peptide-methionine (S)-S-oxide reductase
VCGGDGHTEALKIEFDPDVISYDSLLTMFWAGEEGYKNTRITVVWSTTPRPL